MIVQQGRLREAAQWRMAADLPTPGDPQMRVETRAADALSRCEARVMVALLCGWSGWMTGWRSDGTVPNGHETGLLVGRRCDLGSRFGRIIRAPCRRGQVAGHQLVPLGML